MNLEKNYSLMKFRTDNNLNPDKVKLGEIDKNRNRTQLVGVEDNKHSIDFDGGMVDKSFEI